MKALILIECQNEWLAPNGKLQRLIEDRDMFDESVGNIIQVLQHARQIKMPVAHVGLRFQEGYPELAHGKSGLNKAIPEFGTFQLNEFGSRFYEPFRPIEGEFVVTGRTGASGFAGSNLDIWLRNNKIEDIYLTGYATHVCVESTLREAHDKGYNPILLQDATSAFNRMQQNYVVNEIVHHFGQHLSTQEFLSVSLSR
ncbi:isochorismatase family cysteine hydrolase [Chitinophaga flava]|uniref:Cysteine hydrolase n=1 Tax=Chitinophaga flava TaxID=2259036 RepID=A0A365Y1U1_9BACT|nr:cysteine hydrolase family protein [Chitinophaga flava]RBL92211.1 cysteine hydrolase [Chitinophaga flava]